MSFGTHGLKDGSTLFWQTKLNQDKKAGIEKLTNTVWKSLFDIIGKIKCKNPKWSATLLSSGEIWPEYAENLDILLLWCYSDMTPRAP